MPFYVVKVTDKHGWENPPIVANCADEEAAIDLVRLVSSDDDIIEVKGVRPDVMKAAFGDVPEGAAIFRHDWDWAEDGSTPQPY